MLAQNPHIIFITPAPVNEYQLEDFDNSKNTVHPSRTVALTKTYAEGIRELGASLNIPVVDIWSAFMSSVGWEEDSLLLDLETFLIARRSVVFSPMVRITPLNIELLPC